MTHVRLRYLERPPLLVELFLAGLARACGLSAKAEAHVGIALCEIAQSAGGAKGMVRA